MTPGDILGAGGGIAMIGLIVFAVVVLVLWFFLPFAVFGIKPLIGGHLRRLVKGQDALVEEMRTTNRLLAEAIAARRIARMNAEAEEPQPKPDDAPREPLIRR